MTNYPQELAQDAVCQSHTGHMTGLWFLPSRPLRLNTNEWMHEYIGICICLKFALKHFKRSCMFRSHDHGICACAYTMHRETHFVFIVWICTVTSSKGPGIPTSPHWCHSHVTNDVECKQTPPQPKPPAHTNRSLNLNSLQSHGIAYIRWPTVAAYVNQYGCYEYWTST